MERGERFYHIHRALKGGRCVPLSKFEEELEVSRATFNRDIQYLRDRYRAPIIYDAELRGYRYDGEAKEAATFELPGLWFSPEELHALLTMHALLEEMGSGLLSEQVQALRKRLEDLLGDGRAAFGELRKRVRILSPGKRVAAGDAFSKVAQAVLDRRNLHIRYWARSSDEETERTISPQRIIHHRGNWYVDAWCHLRKGLRNFSVDSIRSIRVLDEPALEVPEADLERALGASYGVFSGKSRKWAVLKFDPLQARWVRDEIWHPEQVGRMQRDGYYVLKVPFSSEVELAMDVQRYGGAVEVMEPASLRAVVHEQGLKLASRNK